MRPSQNGNQNTINEIGLKTGSLLTSTVRVEAPFIRLKIGDYTFGVYEGKKSGLTHNGIYRTSAEKFPNYVKSLKVQKVNGTVNTYDIQIEYPVGFDDDPNFFEKVFSSISSTRKISIDYGDFNLLNYIYRDEEAIITSLQTGVDVKSAKLTYSLQAVSSTKLSLANTHSFPAFIGKPSDKIKQILRKNSQYHLLDVFTGMKESNIDSLILGNDKSVSVPTCVNISCLDYISKLVSYMTPLSAADNSIKQGSIYMVSTFEDTEGTYGGPYIKVINVDKTNTDLDSLCTYNVEIGYPTANLVTEFNLKQQDNWSIYYDYNMANNNSNYITVIDNNGNETKEYSPLLTGTKYAI